MPRIPTRMILDAYRHDPLLPLLLQECRTIHSAKNELRWLKERAVTVAQSSSTKRSSTTSKHALYGWRGLLRSMCRARSRGKPLQYILGDQPFGDLDIMCKKGVLIPRPETETFTVHAASLISRDILKFERHSRSGDHAAPAPAPAPTPLRIIDLCTGTGCIPLLLHALLSPHVPEISIVGIDISTTALNLSERNLMHNVKQGSLSARAMADITFRQGNVLSGSKADPFHVENILQDLSKPSVDTPPPVNVIISNPPYISAESFADGTTTRSVRMYEPKLALVPPVNHVPLAVALDRQEDIFYYHIISLSFGLKAGLVVLECGDRLQGRRVAALCTTLAHEHSQSDSLHVSVWPSGNDESANGSGSGSAHVDAEPCIVILHRTGSN
ncbi:hypothetical protein BO70DRAFT_362503 [Aspergillus heteromorphus CBS 117.55]|uniref:S-adenosyl-L-methionine-dependent methyltransferase n=1 Tax=Aspergillus heteromorphus CBS 117.55 TaxID=1448321 RepID=A0A317W5E6_9EURO|nr:uncharacterized protein BO70DRAFT_362503 [Aspergillus heteromorphus CBS 117.55]PWY80552.1 hypothetical protein BO70DRAFT_362503 [Aspergillus heteromorphus CBS 117.55]